jgi:phytoene dehydrogenase-like protein
MNMHDAIVIGAGHNGLVAAATLARAGKKVLVLESRPVIGGAALTEEIHPGFRSTTCAYSSGLFQDSIAQALDLRKFGYETIDFDPALFAPSASSDGLFFWNSAEKTAEGLAARSAADSANYVRFQKEVSRYAGFLRPLFLTSLPDPATVGASDTGELLSLAWKLRKAKQRDINEMLRILAMSIADLLNEYFENDHLKGVLASDGILGSFYGPRSSGSVFLMLYLRMGRGNGTKQQWPFVRGGMGTLSEAIAQSARAAGAEIRTSAEVAHVLIKDGVARGVVLKDGEEIAARVVLSNADAKRTFLKLVDPVHLEPHFAMAVKNIKARGVSAKVNLALDRYPQWRGLGNEQPAAVCIAPSMDYLEHAFDDAKYGNFSRAPFLDIAIPSVVDPTVAPEGKHVMSIYVLFAPYHLKKGDWNSRRNELGDAVIRTLEEYAPGLSSSILKRQVVTPLDLETEFGLTEGHIHHGEISLDQIFFMRPVPGYSRYRTPVSNLYLCGAAAHPGGGVTGIPGSNAAAAVLQDLREGKA